MTSAANKLYFGTAGVPRTSLSSSTLSGIKRVAELNLDCLEIQFVRGIKIGIDLAKEIKAASQALNVKLSVHAPYYVNLNSVEEGKRLSSQERLLHSARVAHTCGAQSVVFHPGYYGNLPPEMAFEVIKKELMEVVSILKLERNSVILRPETMGKKSQFGSLEEILMLCREVEGLLPCIDFSHLHSRNGKGNSYNEFCRILRKTEKKLGISALKKAHIHISGAEYTGKGEIKHVNLEESDFRFDEWIQALRDMKVEGMVICESPHQEQDALMLKNLFLSTL